MWWRENHLHFCREHVGLRSREQQNPSPCGSCGHHSSFRFPGDCAELSSEGRRVTDPQLSTVCTSAGLYDDLGLFLMWQQFRLLEIWNNGIIRLHIWFFIIMQSPTDFIQDAMRHEHHVCAFWGSVCSEWAANVFSSSNSMASVYVAPLCKFLVIRLQFVIQVDCSVI